VFFQVYREEFYFVDQFHGSVLHGDQSTASCEAYTDFAYVSTCLMADNIEDEVVTIHRSQEMLKILFRYT
jgi:hypothetical protein